MLRDGQVGISNQSNVDRHGGEPLPCPNRSAFQTLPGLFDENVNCEPNFRSGTTLTLDIDGHPELGDPDATEEIVVPVGRHFKIGRVVYKLC